MKKQRLLSYILIIGASISPIYGGTESKKLKTTIAEDIVYTGAGIACCAGAFFAAKLTLELHETLETFTPETPISLLNGFIKLATNSKLAGHALRWMEWYPGDPVAGGTAETIGCGLLTGGLGIAGLLFIAKGLHLRK